MELLPQQRDVSNSSSCKAMPPNSYQPTEKLITKIETDFNIDQIIIGEVLKSFNSFDKNGDGVISKDELSSAIALITPHLQQKPTEAEIADMVAAVDKNEDGMIQFEEFVALVAPRIDTVLPVDGVVGVQDESGETRLLKVPSSNKTSSDSGISESRTNDNLDLEQVFKIFDTNGDGFISRNEIEKVMFQLGEPVTTEDVDNMTLGKEHLNFDQFKQVITSNSKCASNGSLNSTLEGTNAVSNISITEVQASQPVRVAVTKNASGASSSRTRDSEAEIKSKSSSCTPKKSCVIM